MSDLTPRAVKSLPNTSRVGTTDAETRLETLLNIKMDESETKSSVPNNQIPTQPARPLPADSYKNNLLKAKAEEESKAELKNAELSSSAENVISPRKNLNLSNGDSPSKEISDKSSATFVSVGGDKLTLSLGSGNTNLMDLESVLPISTQPSNLELLSALSTPIAPSSSLGSGVNNLTFSSTLSSALTPISTLTSPMTPLSNLSAPLNPSQLPVSITHFSQNGVAGLQKETLFSDTISMMNPTTNPFTNPFINTTTNDESNGQKFATIGRSNPFTYSNKSKNPFLDRLDAQHHGNGELTSGSPMSTSPGTSPEASLDPVSDNGSSTSTLNKIETTFASSQPVTRSLSSVGTKPGISSSRLPVLATSLSKTSILNNRNTMNNKFNSENLANGHNSNIINNNSNNLQGLQGDTSLEEISPWLVKDNMILNKKMDKSKIPLLKTVITTEL